MDIEDEDVSIIKGTSFVSLQNLNILMLLF